MLCKYEKKLLGRWILSTCYSKELPIIWSVLKKLDCDPLALHQLNSKLRKVSICDIMCFYFEPNSSILVHCSLQFVGTACTVLYCLLWDGSDGVLDRQGWTNHPRVSWIIVILFKFFKVSFPPKMQVSSAALSKSKDMPLHNCLHERNPPKVDSIVEWFIQFTQTYEIFKNLWLLEIQAPMLSSIRSIRSTSGCQPCPWLLLAFRQRSRHYWPTKRRAPTGNGDMALKEVDPQRWVFGKWINCD